MPFTSGTAEVGDEPSVICSVGRGRTVKVKNLDASTAVYVGGPGVTTDGDGAGYPLDGRESETFSALIPREAVAIPAPADDMAPDVLYGRTERGRARVAWISA